MQNFDYTISVATANSTINRMHSLLTERNVKLKRSDLKELVASLMRFETSNELDARIKKYKADQDAQSIYEKTGAHKTIPKVVCKRFDSTEEALKFSQKFSGFNSITTFEEPFESQCGHKYKYGDVIYANTHAETLQVLLDWKANTQFDFVLYSGEERKQHSCDGYWECTLTSDALLKEMGHRIFFAETKRFDHLGTRDTDKGEVFVQAFEALNDLDLPFQYFSQADFQGFSYEEIQEDYERRNGNPPNLKSYQKLVEEYLDVLTIQEIAKIDVFSHETKYLAELKNYGVKYDDPALLISAATGGKLENCEFLLANGASVESLYGYEPDESENIYIHNKVAEYAFFKSDDSKEARTFFTTLVALGIDLNYKDSFGDTFLHILALHFKVKLYGFVVGLGANAQIRDADKQTAEEVLAEIKQYKENSDDSLEYIPNEIDFR